MVGSWVTGAALFVAAVFAKEFVTAAAKHTVVPAFQWLGALFAMPKTIRGLDGLVKDLDKRVGRNGRESVFELLHAQIIKERRIVDTLGVLMWHSDAEGRCVWASQALQNAVGYSFEEGFAGAAWLRLFYDSDRALVADLWDDAITHKHPFEWSGNYRAKTGMPVPVALRADILPSGGAVVTVVLSES